MRELVALPGRWALCLAFLGGLGALGLAPALGASPSRAAENPPPARPRLVTVIIIDGLSNGQLQRHLDLLGDDGIRRLIREGRSFSRARYGHASTFTAAGHATLSTGVSPREHGLIGNQWFDRERDDDMYCVRDDAHDLLGEPTPRWRGTSPRNLLVPTLGDRLVEASEGQARVFAVSLKDRAAIACAGHRGTAFWQSSATGRFTTSDYYRKDLPDWLQRFESEHSPDRSFDVSWDPEEGGQRPWHALHHRAVDVSGVSGLGETEPHFVDGGLERPGPAFYRTLRMTPIGDQQLEQFAETLIRGEGLGHRHGSFPDLLYVSFSATDYVNHYFGPDSPEATDVLVQVDRDIASLLGFLEDWVDEGGIMVALSADHGFASATSFYRAEGFDAGRADPRALRESLEEELVRRFGHGRYVRRWATPNLYLDTKAPLERGLDSNDVIAAAARFLREWPGIAAVFTRNELEGDEAPARAFGEAVWRSYHRGRSGDLVLVQRPFWFLLAERTRQVSTHGSPYPYDQHVPLVVWGVGIQAGQDEHEVFVRQLAPTLARAMGIGASWPSAFLLY